MRSLNGHIVWGLGCAVGLNIGAAHAQTSTAGASASDKLEEIVITAERRESDIQKTATSVSVRGGEELEQQGRYSLADILRDIPNVSGGEPNAGAAGGSEARGGGITIRGVSGSPGGGGPAGTVSGSATTAVYVDGVYEGLGGDYDIQRVEVLRGPQGTLYGRSATSGVVGTYTRDPTLDEFNGNATVQLSNYTRQLYTGALNVPIGSSFAVRAAVSKAQADKGYYNGEGGAYDRVHGRVKALWQATENLSLLFGFAFEENDQNTGGCSATSPQDGVVLYDNCLPVSTTHNHGRQYWIDFKWDLGPVTLFYQPTLRTFNQNTPGAGVVGPFNRPMTQTIQTPHDQFVTQELRLASNNESKLSWQTGFFYYWNNIRSENNNHWTESGALLFDSPTSRDTKDYGVFGEATYEFTDATRLTLGGRWDYTRVNTSQVYTDNRNFACNAPAPGLGCLPGVSPGPGVGLPEVNVVAVVNENTTPSGLSSWHKTNYKVRFEHDLTPQNMVFAMVSTGFIPGDVNVSSGGVTPYDAESLTAFEVGSKNRFLEESLQLNVGVFYYDYGGFQLTVQPDSNNPTSVFNTTVPARMIGAELETLYQLTSKDRFGLNYAFLDSRFVDKPADFAAYIPWEHVASSSGIAAIGTGSSTAPHTVTANYEHVFTLPGSSTLLARIDGMWRSSYRYWNPSTPTLASFGPDIMNYAYLDSGATGNINVNWTSAGGNFSVGAYVRNFTDHVWNTYDVRSLVPTPPATTRTVNVFQTEPRTYGVILSAKF